ncbi:phytoene/squalene synthase family protein [Actinoalloteichus hymeniacidonis]|uniref:Phytoene/squalene synthetase n=1 Tax=Actinoalloteichus hymeniacidonis TaxID=340345 RepID=A0AAC9MYD5_9PSEU|nr:phytoene/squalene synthase family protein [Actinoalloteichus hymeniacidonis]AOS62791.1 phytoene/squalene synthetase [Actinoalloteichus hymeniacidonis]MBB5909178.1 phytoene synthase [Actinoalloteichus hymeniacidonis]
MSPGELDAAGIEGTALRRSYLRCRALHARFGRTYFLATRLLRPEQRPAVHALYGFARWVDDIVDEPGGEDPAPRLDRVADRVAADLHATHSTHAVLAALVDTVRRYGIDHRLFTDFLTSMRMDLTVTEYPSDRELAGYIRGSAEVIGLQLLPVLGTVVADDVAAEHAAALGAAFQLTNFLRDVGQDLDRGRIYLPMDELATFGVDRELLRWCRRTGRTEPRLRRAVAHFIARNRAVYRRALPGIPMLAPVARPCVTTAAVLYQGILSEIEAADFDVVSRRAVVPRRRRLAVVVPTLAHSIALRMTAAR